MHEAGPWALIHRGIADARRLAGWGRAPLQLAALALVGVFWGLYLARIWNQLVSYSWRWSAIPVVGAVLIWGLYTLAQALGWLFLARTAGGQVTAPQGVRVWLLSMPARYIPGNVWHILSRVYLGNRVGLRPGPVLVASTVEQGMMIMGPLMVFLLSLVAWSDRVDSRFLFLALLIPVGLACLHPRILQPLIMLASKVFHKPAPVLELRYRHLLAVAGWYTALHFASGTAGYLVVVSLAPLPLSDLPMLAGAYSLAYVVGYLSLLTPTGLGVREAALLGLLSTMVPAPVAAVAALLSRGLSSLGEGLCIVSAGALWRWRPHDRSTQPIATE